MSAGKRSAQEQAAHNEDLLAVIGVGLCALPVIAVALYAMWQYPLLAVIGIMALLCILAELLDPGTT